VQIEKHEFCPENIYNVTCTLQNAYHQIWAEVMRNLTLTLKFALHQTALQSRNTLQIANHHSALH